jgi:hypothetical protein
MTDINNIVNGATESPYLPTCACLDNAVSSKDNLAQNRGISEHQIANK